MNQLNKILVYIINGCLVLLVAAAWFASRYPAYSSMILVGVVTAGIAVGLAGFLLSGAKPLASVSALPDHAAKSLLSLGSQLSADTSGRPLSKDASSSFIRTTDLQHYLLDVLRCSETPAINVPHFLYYDRAPPAKIEHFFELTPPIQENYTVRVGVVTVRVNKGSAEIRIDTKPDQAETPLQRDAQSEKVDVLLRPELAKSWFGQA